MATEDTRAGGATTAPTQEYEVMLRLAVSPDPPSEDALEELAIAALEALEAGAPAATVGAAVACEFSPPAIVLDFNVAAGSNVEMHAKVGEVLAAIEDRLEIQIRGLSETAAPAEPAELVAC